MHLNKLLQNVATCLCINLISYKSVPQIWATKKPLTVRQWLLKLLQNGGYHLSTSSIELAEGTALTMGSVTVTVGVTISAFSAI